MDINAQLIATAERLFDHDGFNATGMGRLVSESGLSSRTVYKHVVSKNRLMAQVLTQRQSRFFAQTEFASIDALFGSLRHWVEREGARGCLFFRTRAETGGAIPEIEAAVAEYHARLRAGVAELVARETGHHEEELTDQILSLFEGAITVASYRDCAVIEAAAQGARQLIAGSNTR